MPRMIAAIVLCAVLLTGCAYYHVDTPDAPGGWIPSTAGSGWCTAHGIEGIKDGTRTYCPTPER